MDHTQAPQPVPDGFALISTGDETFLVDHQRTGMAGMNVFLAGFLVAWIIAQALAYGQLTGQPVDDGTRAWLFLAALATVCGIAFLAYLVLCQTSFSFEPGCLTIESTVLSLSRTRTIARSSVHRVVQVRDGGRNRDSFPSWGLRIEGDKNTTVLYRQPFEKSDWLGTLIAAWADAPYLQDQTGPYRGGSRWRMPSREETTAEAHGRPRPRPPL